MNLARQALPLLASLAAVTTACSSGLDFDTPPVPPTPIPPAAATATAVAAPAPEWPIRVGVLHSTTGPWVFEGVAANDGIKAYLETEKYQVGKRKVELIFEDTEGRPEVAVTKLRKLVEQDNVAMVVGPMSDAEALAVRDAAELSRVPVIMSLPNLGAVTTANLRYVYRITGNYQTHSAAGWYAARKLNARNAALIITDYAAGREAADAFRLAYEAAGGSVGMTVRVPLGVADLKPYLEQLRTTQGVDLVVAPSLLGQGAGLFIKAYAEGGLKGRVPLLVGGQAVAEGDALNALGDAAVGVLSYDDWALTLDSPESKAFQTAMAALKLTATEAALNGWMEGQAVVALAKAAGGKLEDPLNVAGLLKDVTFTSPRGPVRFDARHQAVTSVYVRRVERAGDALRNTVTDTIENVDQAWRGPN